MNTGSASTPEAPHASDALHANMGRFPKAFSLASDDGCGGAAHLGAGADMVTQRASPLDMGTLLRCLFLCALCAHAIPFVGTFELTLVQRTLSRNKNLLY